MLLHVPKVLSPDELAYCRQRMQDAEDLTSAQERVHQILISARPLGDVDDPAMWPGYRLIWPHLTQEQLARQAAATRQSVNAALRGFEKRGWISVDGRAVTVRQPEMLARFVAT